MNAESNLKGTNEHGPSFENELVSDMRYECIWRTPFERLNVEADLRIQARSRPWQFSTKRVGDLRASVSSANLTLFAKKVRIAGECCVKRNE